MTPVTVVGMAAGAILILTASGIFWAKKAFPAGGVVVAIVAFILIGMSQWSSIKFSAAGASLEAFRTDLKQTAAAAGEVAAQAEHAAVAAEATKSQLTELATLLEHKHLLTPAAMLPYKARIAATPTVDLSKLHDAQSVLNRIRRS